jgi:hypothetical protein
MEYNKHINIRISEDQLNRLLEIVAKDKTTLSELIRKIFRCFEYEEFRGRNSCKRK